MGPVLRQRYEVSLPRGRSESELRRPLQPIFLGGAKEVGIVYINIIRGAKEPRNLQNHRGDYV